MRMTAAERSAVIARLTQADISLDDAKALRRIALTLRRWDELKRGKDDWTIERDAKTGKPYRRYTNGCHVYPGMRLWQNVPDRETGALKRLAKIMTNYPGLVAYHQADLWKGKSLYLVPRSFVTDGCDIAACYDTGIAIY